MDLSFWVLSLWVSAFVVHASTAAAQCAFWKRGNTTQGSRPGTESGALVALSDNGAVLAIEEYGNHGGPYKKGGHGTGRLRVLSWDDLSHSYKDRDIFTEGLTTGLSLSSDGSLISTIGFNISNDGFYSELDHVVQVYEYNQEGVWLPRGTTLSRDNGLSYYPSQQALSKDGTTLAIGGEYGDNLPMEDWKSIHRIYRYDSSDLKWKQIGNDCIVDGGIFRISLAASGDSMAILAWQSTNTLIGTVFDLKKGAWVPRAGTITVSELTSTIFDVKLSDDGSILIIQGYEELPEQGLEGFVSAYKYSKIDGVWNLRAPTIKEIGLGITSWGSSGDGDLIVTGGVDDDETFGTGHIRIFRFNGTTYEMREKIGAATGGGSLAISTSGSFFASGAHFLDEFTGRVEVYECIAGYAVKPDSAS